MAEVAIALATTITVEQFSGVPGGGIYPRARLTAVHQGTVAAKIATNTQHVTATVNLPRNFAYVMDAMFFSLRSATAATEVDQYNSNAFVRVSSDGSATTAILNMTAPGLSFFSAVDDGLKIWTMPVKFSDLIFNQSSALPQLTYVIQDDDAVNATVVTTANFFATYLVYDILQATEVQVNAPQPVSIRG